MTLYFVAVPFVVNEVVDFTEHCANANCNYLLNPDGIWNSNMVN